MVDMSHEDPRGISESGTPEGGDRVEDVKGSSSSLAGRVLKALVLLVAAGVVVALGLLLYQILRTPPAPRTMLELKIDKWEKAVKKDPSDPASQVELGAAYLEAGRDGKAVEHFEIAVKLAPENWLTHYAVANAYVVTGKKKEAIKEFESAIGILPDNGALRYGLGELYFRDENYKTAALVLEGAVVVEPSAADTRALLGRAYEYLGRTEDAIVQYKEALRYAPDLDEATAGLARLETGGAK